MGKTSTQNSVQDIDPQLREESDITMDAGRILAGGLGDARYKGNTIAAPSEQTRASWDAANAAGSAFGLGPAGGGNIVPEGTPDSRGIMGFSGEDTMQDSGSVTPELEDTLDKFYERIGTQATNRGPMQLPGGGKK